MGIFDLWGDFDEASDLWGDTDGRNCYVGILIGVPDVRGHCEGELLM